jgi:hypothetical protein
MKAPDLVYGLQLRLNDYFDGGADEVRKTDIDVWIDPESIEFGAILCGWVAGGYVRVLKEPGLATSQEPFLKLLRRFEPDP